MTAVVTRARLDAELVRRGLAGSRGEDVQRLIETYLGQFAPA